jgi:hypothetical protein
MSPVLDSPPIPFKNVKKTSFTPGGCPIFSLASEKSFRKSKIDFVEYKIRLPLHPHTKTGQRKRGKKKQIAG